MRKRCRAAFNSLLPTPPSVSVNVLRHSASPSTVASQTASPTMQQPDETVVDVDDEMMQTQPLKRTAVSDSPKTNPPPPQLQAQPQPPAPAPAQAQPQQQQDTQPQPPSNSNAVPSCCSGGEPARAYASFTSMPASLSSGGCAVQCDSVPVIVPCSYMNTSMHLHHELKPIPVVPVTVWPAAINAPSTELHTPIPTEQAVLIEFPPSVFEEHCNALQAMVDSSREQGLPVDYLSRPNQEIQEWMRKKVVDWISETCANTLRMDRNTAVTAILNFDRFMAKNVVQKRILQLVAVACILVASKLHEHESPTLEECRVVCGRAYSVESIRTMEILLMENLTWCARLVTPHQVLLQLLTTFPFDVQPRSRPPQHGGFDAQRRGNDEPVHAPVPIHASPSSVSLASSFSSASSIPTYASVSPSALSDMSTSAHPSPPPPRSGSQPIPSPTCMTLRDIALQTPFLHHSNLAAADLKKVPPCPHVRPKGPPPAPRHEDVGAQEAYYKFNYGHGVTSPKTVMLHQTSARFLECCFVVNSFTTSWCPVTLAMASLVCAFNECGVDCTEWLRNVCSHVPTMDTASIVACQQALSKHLRCRFQPAPVPISVIPSEAQQHGINASGNAPAAQLRQHPYSYAHVVRMQTHP